LAGEALNRDNPRRGFFENGIFVFLEVLDLSLGGSNESGLDF
jgi:hypothetical protein